MKIIPAGATLRDDPHEPKYYGHLSGEEASDPFVCKQVWKHMRKLDLPETIRVDVAVYGPILFDLTGTGLYPIGIRPVKIKKNEKN